MRNCLRIMVAVAIAVMSVVGIHGVAVAASGSITGSVYSDNTSPINGAHVVVYGSDNLSFVADTHASPLGAYSITGLESGTYRVKVEYPGYVTEYVDPVTVTDPNPTSVPDFFLALGSTISGTVYTENGTTPLPISAHVVAYENVTNPGEWTWFADSHSDNNGFYTITTGTGDGAYLVMAEARGYMHEYFDNVTTKAAATPVDVTALTDTPDVDFTLAESPYISGIAYAADGVTKITTASITAYENSTGSWVWAAQGHTGADPAGYYFINVDDGTYKIKAQAEGYIDQWWENVTTRNDASPITIADGGEYPDMNFFLSPVLAVTTNAASAGTATLATLNGNLTAMGDATSVDVSFEWGTDITYGEGTTTPVAMTATGPFSASLAGLSPSTTYHFRAKAVGDTTPSEPKYGADLTFTTNALGLPELTTGDATLVTTTAATLNGNLISPGTADNVTVSFEYGTATGSYTSATDNQTLGAAATFSANLTGLAAGTTYYFRANAAGDGAPVYGAEKSFTTSALPTTAPSVTTDNATTVATTSATLKGNLTSLGTADNVTVSFEWKVSGGSYVETTVQTLTAAGAFSANLTGLTAGTTYYFKAKADGDGDPVYGAENSFTTTTVDSTGPVISLGEPSDLTTSGATIKWTTDEAATSQVEYGLTEDYNLSTGLDASLVTNHSVELTDLKAGKTYHYRVISKDAAGNQTVSEDATFKTTGGSGGMPVWGWVLIGLAAVGVLGAAAFVIKGKMAAKPQQPPQQPQP